MSREPGTHLVAHGYERAAFLALLKRTGRFRADLTGNASAAPPRAQVLGVLELEDITVPVLEVPVADAERKRWSDWEAVCAWLCAQQGEAALCVFYDARRAFRLALIGPRSGKARPPVSGNFRRWSLLVQPGCPNRTFRERVPLLMRADSREALLEVFDAEAVGRAFYAAYVKIFQESVVSGIYGESSRQTYQDFFLAFTVRVLFLSFVAKKGWLGDQGARFLPWLLERYQTVAQQEEATGFYNRWLRPLFFEAFRAAPSAKTARFRTLPEDIAIIYRDAPFLNGELFRRQPFDARLALTDEVIARFFTFLYGHNFILEESTHDDVDLELAPELLGLILEQLINGVGITGVKEQVGAHYTPRVEVDLMVRLALMEALVQRAVLDRAAAARFVFEGKLERDQALAVRKTLEDLKVLDPAVGSGAFLVGMLQVLEELLDRTHESLGDRCADRVQRRRRLIAEVLHGVDVLRWAVWMTELRLWLALLVDLDDRVRHTSGPILPSLGLRVVQGDALIQRIGKRLLPMRPDGPLWNRPEIRALLQQLNECRRAYFENQGSLEQVRAAETALFQAMVQQERRRLQQQASSTGELFQKTGRSSGDAETQQQWTALQELLDAAAMGHRPFVWWVDFSDVMVERGGFDVVIGNPPYVRQEQISDVLGDLTPSAYKAMLAAAYRMDWEAIAGSRLPAVQRRADLYVYFYVRSLRLLNDRGVHVFIASNSWLDVDFGSWLQELFLRYAPLRLVLENRSYRSFAAGINTAITVALAPRPIVHREPVRFCALYRAFEEVHPADILQIVEAAQDLRREAFRVLVRAPNVLLQEAGRTGKYSGSKWGGKYLRAPDIFYTLFEQGQSRWVQLGDIAEVRRGITTGVNEFFYLEPVGRTVEEVATLAKQDPSARVPVRNSRGWEGRLEAAWLRPIIKSSREIRTLKVGLENLRYLVLMPPEEVRAHLEANLDPPLARYPGILDYIRWGETRGYPKRPTCSSRRWWWDLGERPIGQVLCMMTYNDRHPFWVNTVALSDNRLYDLYVKTTDPLLLAALMNTTLVPLQMELLGRINLGEGALDFKVYEAAALLCPAPDVLSSDEQIRLLTAFQAMVDRPVRSLFEELGFPRCRRSRCTHPDHPYEHVVPEMLTLDQVRQAAPERFQMDTVVCRALGLNDREQLEVYRAVTQLVLERLRRARTVHP